MDLIHSASAHWPILIGVGVVGAATLYYFSLEQAPPPKKRPVRTSNYIPPPPLQFSKKALFDAMETTRALPLVRLPVAVDFPRLARKMTIWDGDKLIVDGSDDQYGHYDTAYEEQARITLMNEIWVRLAELVGEDYPIVKTHLRDSLQNGDIAVLLANFLRDHIPEDSIFVRIMKVCNQSMLAPAVVRMKETIGQNKPYKDQRGQWTISIVVEADRIVVTHIKHETSWEDPKLYEEQHFTFSWMLRMEFDKEAREMTNVTVKICSVDFADGVSAKTRQEILDNFSRCECVDPL